jgi:hypothetical protein
MAMPPNTTIFYRQPKYTHETAMQTKGPLRNCVAPMEGTKGHLLASFPSVYP